MEPLRPQPKVGGQDGSQTPHGNTDVELVHVHLNLRSHPGPSINKRSPTGHDAHLERDPASREDASGHRVDSDLEQRLTSADPAHSYG